MLSLILIQLIQPIAHSNVVFMLDAVSANLTSHGKCPSLYKKTCILFHIMHSMFMIFVVLVNKFSGLLVVGMKVGRIFSDYPSVRRVQTAFGQQIRKFGYLNRITDTDIEQCVGYRIRIRDARYPSDIGYPIGYLSGYPSYYLSRQDHTKTGTKVAYELRFGRSIYRWKAKNIIFPIELISFDVLRLFVYY